MRKRQFLKAASGLAIGSLAGCMGYTVKRTEEVNRLEKRLETKSGEVENLEEKVQNQSKRIDELNQEIESLEEENSEKSDEIDSLESELESEKEKQVLYLYGYGITHYNDGLEYYNSAIDYSENERYNAARADLNVAAGYMEAAVTNFDAASSRASEIDANTVQDWCQDANQRADGMASAVADYQIAMEYYDRGRDSEGDEYINQGDTHYQTAQNYEIRDRSTLEDELGTSINT